MSDYKTTLLVKESRRLRFCVWCVISVLLGCSVLWARRPVNSKNGPELALGMDTPLLRTAH
jgi:hypothetical protein